MAIGRTARGTGNGTASSGSGAYQLSASVTVGATGSTLIVMFSRDESVHQIAGMTWNGIALTSRANSGSVNVLDCFALENATAGTGALVIDDTAGAIGKWEFIATEVTGAAVASFDKQAGAEGTGTSPSSGNTATTTQTTEMLVGGIFRLTAVVDGTWSGSFTGGQSTTQTLRSLEEGYRSVTSTGTYAAAKTGVTSAAWIAVVATFKQNLNQTTTASTITAAATVAAVALVLGGIATSCDSVSGSGNVMAPKWSLARVVEPVSVVTGVPLQDGLTLDTYRGDTQTVRAATVDGTSAPVTLRSNTSPLGDADWSTYTSVSATFGSGSGTSLVDGSGVASTGISGSGEIAGVAFFVACRSLHDHSGLVYANARMGSVPFTMTPAYPTAGSVSSPPAWSVLTTGVVATSDGSTPWTWDTLYSALSSGVMAFRINWTNSAPFVDVGQIDVADIWVEVWGPAGAQPDPIKIKQVLGPPPSRQSIGVADSVQHVRSIINGG